MVWMRLLLLVVVAASIGAGAFFIALGVLPEPALSSPEPGADNDIDWLYLEKPELETRKDRMTTASAIGFAAGTIAALALYFVNRRWIAPPAAQARA